MLTLNALLVLAGCARDGDPPDDSIATGLPPKCASNALIPAVLECDFTSGASGAGSVEYWPVEDPTDVRTTPAGPVGTNHHVAVLGLKAGHGYGYRAVVDSPTARVVSAPGTHTVPDVPSDFPVLTLDSVDPDRSATAGSYVLLSIAVLDAARFTIVAIVDGDGDYVWWRATEANGLAIGPHFSRDGLSVRYLQSDMAWESDVGTLHRVALDGSGDVTTRAELGHHAMWENADGTLSWLGFVYATIGGTDWSSDAIRTIAEGATDADEPTVEFNWFDAYPRDPWQPDPSEDLVSLGTGIEWTHSNSLMALDDASFYVMSKKLDCLLKVDRASGAIDWQLGGQLSDFTGPNGEDVWKSLTDDALFSHSHMSDLWDGGMAVFDNGDYHVPQVTRAVEYAFDEDLRTVEQVWSYTEPDHGHTGSMGDVRKLANGNYLVSWATLGYVSEVTPEGDVVWRLSMDVVGSFGRLTPLTDLYAPPDPSRPSLP
jgi:hypothetical protein